MREAETNAAKKHMHAFLWILKTAGKLDCEKCIKIAESGLENLPWTDVKNYLYNQNVKKKEYGKEITWEVIAKRILHIVCRGTS